MIVESMWISHKVFQNFAGKAKAGWRSLEKTIEKNVPRMSKGRRGEIKKALENLTLTGETKIFDNLMIRETEIDKKTRGTARGKGRLIEIMVVKVKKDQLRGETGAMTRGILIGAMTRRIAKGIAPEIDRGNS